jgi:hypothetical protein
MGKGDMQKKSSKTMEPSALIQEIRGMIEEARAAVATTVNVTLTILFWKNGKRVREEILKEKRAEYGERIVHALSSQLMTEYGGSFGGKNLRRIVQFAEDSPIGLILCAGKKQETIELLELEKSSIRVAEYLTELPPKELLEKKLHTAIQRARVSLEMKEKNTANE